MIKYKDSIPKYSTVAKWSSELKRGRDFLKDDPIPSGFADDVSQEMIDRVERRLLNDVPNLLQNVAFLR